MKKKIILAITLLIVIIGAIFFITKSTKHEFISYIISDDIWNVLEEHNIEKYTEKQSNTPYTNKGQVSITTNGLKEKTLGIIQDINWLFEGKNNKTGDILEQDILIDIENNSLIKFKKDNEKIGIQTGLLGSKFVAIENKIEDKEFSSNEVKDLGNKYLKIINKHITTNQFLKEKIENETVLSLSITEKEIIEITKDILKESRDDEIILRHLEEDVKIKMQGEIDTIITEMDSLEINPNNKFIIKLYVKSNDIQKYEIVFMQQEKEISRTTIQNTENEILITTYQDDELLLEGNLSKQKEEKDIIYSFSIKVYIEGQKIEFTLNTQYKNLLELQNVEEIIDVKISYEDQNKYGNLENTSNLMEININYLNQKTFENNLEIEGLNEENTIILNKAKEEELKNIMNSIYKSLGIL